jgi:alcohol dehydrogenase (cytochrome c)
MIAQPPVMTAAAEVTAERLSEAAREPHNWLMSDGDYGAHRYSPLTEINHGNVSKLKLVFSVPIGDIATGDTFERLQFSAPLVEDGMMYVADGLGRVSKIELAEGQDGNRVLWTTETPARNLHAWLEAKWGIALYDRYVILTAGDGSVHWLDKATGALVRTIATGDPTNGYAVAAPPLVAGDRLIIASAGGERGAHPRLQAFDAGTGAPLWETDATGAADDPGSWIPGGSFLRSGAYDPTLDTIIWSTGPHVPRYESSTSVPDADTANSIMGFDAATGALKWKLSLGDAEPGAAQAATSILTNSGSASQPGSMAMHVGDDGYFYRIDAATGALIGATRFIEAPGWASSIDPESGLPLHTVEQLATRPGCPNVHSEDAMPASFSERTGLVYGAENHGCIIDPPTATTGMLGDLDVAHYAHKTNMIGALAALDPATGEKRAEQVFNYPLQSGVLSTAGGLVFTVTADGQVYALDDETLKPLWSYDLTSVTASPPLTYAVDGKQYVAVLIGGSPLYSELPYRPRDMVGVRHLLVLAVFGVVQ